MKLVCERERQRLREIELSELSDGSMKQKQPKTRLKLHWPGGQIRIVEVCADEDARCPAIHNSESLFVIVRQGDDFMRNMKTRAETDQVGITLRQVHDFDPIVEK